MGLLNRFRTSMGQPWVPPVMGACRCEEHLENLLAINVPLHDWTGSVRVAELVGSGALTTVPATEDVRYLVGEVTRERRGPFHWRVLHEDQLDRFLDPASPVSLDDALSIQPGVERVLWNGRRELVLGAPELCLRGVQAAVVRALLNPRVRQWEEVSESARRANSLHEQMTRGMAPDRLIS